MHCLGESEFFYPISGNINSFEILVFPYKNKVHAHLAVQRPGFKQYKFKGPLGKQLQIQQQQRLLTEPFISPMFYHGQQIFDLLQGLDTVRNLVYITTPTRIDPFIQILNTIFLRTNTLLYSHSSFVPRGTLDEMIVQDGDGLIVYEYFDDGYSFANLDGVLPTTLALALLHCVRVLS